MPYLDWQFKRFQSVLTTLAQDGIEPPLAFVANSPIVRLTTNMNLTAVDVGRLLYGLIPPVPPNVELDLRPAFHSLRSRLIQVKSVDRTEFVDRMGSDLRDKMRVGIIPLGIGDGLPQLTCGDVLVKGHRVRVIGMFYEHARLDLSDVQDARLGDEVVVVGRQGDGEISVDEVVHYQKLEFAGGLGSFVRESVPRVFVGGAG
jgi:alanine racemase